MTWSTRWLYNFSRKGRYKELKTLLLWKPHTCDVYTKLKLGPNLPCKRNCIRWCKLSFYFAKKNYFFYFTYQFLQNTHISLSILHIYLIKYSFFYNFLLFSSSLPLSLTDPTLSYRPNTQRKVAVVFISVRAPLFSSVSNFGGSVIEMALLLGSVF